MAISPEKKMNYTGIGKYLLRKSFEGNYVFRRRYFISEKAAFSDAVGRSVVDYLKEYANTQYMRTRDLALARTQYPHSRLSLKNHSCTARYLNTTCRKGCHHQRFLDAQQGVSKTCSVKNPRQSAAQLWEKWRKMMW